MHIFLIKKIIWLICGEMNMKSVIIIGGGCSGLTAAIYLKRAYFNVKVFCDYNNGNLTTTELVENFPGFTNGISGF